MEQKLIKLLAEGSIRLRLWSLRLWSLRLWSQHCFKFGHDDIVIMLGCVS